MIAAPPKCKSKAYRDRRRNLERQVATEAEEVLAGAMAVLAETKVNAVRLQLEHQRIVLLCGCGARTTIQITN